MNKLTQIDGVCLAQNINYSLLRGELLYVNLKNFLG